MCLGTSIKKKQKSPVYMQHLLIVQLELFTGLGSCDLCCHQNPYFYFFFWPIDRDFGQNVSCISYSYRLFFGGIFSCIYDGTTTVVLFGYVLIVDIKYAIYFL